MAEHGTTSDLAANDEASADKSAGRSLGERRLPRRTTVFVLASLVFALACVVLALEFFVVERIPALTEAELENAKALWKAHGPANYKMDIELRGAQPGSIHVEVENREVTATTRDGRVLPKWTWETWTVPGMFDTLAQDLQIAEDPSQEIQAAPGTEWRLRCEFDSQSGLPRRYHRLVTGGPEVYWRVMRFESR